MCAVVRTRDPQGLAQRAPVARVAPRDTGAQRPFVGLARRLQLVDRRRERQHATIAGAERGGPGPRPVQVRGDAYDAPAPAVEDGLLSPDADEFECHARHAEQGVARFEES